MAGQPLQRDRDTNAAGYGEDCQYKNNFFAMQCNVNGGSGSGLTEVVLTQQPLVAIPLRARPLEQSAHQRSFAPCSPSTRR